MPRLPGVLVHNHVRGEPRALAEVVVSVARARLDVGVGASLYRALSLQASAESLVGELNERESY